MHRTPLAWKNLTHDGRRLAVTVSGVGFAVLLIFMELGFLNGLLESTVRMLRWLNGELVLASTSRYALLASEQFPLRRVYQAAQVGGVEHVLPIYMEMYAGVLRLPGKRGYPIRVLAFHLQDHALRIPGLHDRATTLAQPHTALADTASRGKYGIPLRAENLPEFRGELAGKRVSLVGHFRLGVDFATEGNLLMSAENFAEYFPWRGGYAGPLGRVDLAVVQLAPGADRKQVQQQLRATLPNDVQVLGRDELIQREMLFWRTNAPVGYIFLVGVCMGFVVGVVICYQIIYSDIADHMREFATLKAMGYSNGYFVRLVLQQSAYLTLMGFIPGMLVGYIAYFTLAAYTGLTMQMTMPLIATVFVVTLFMCAISGMLALRKLLAVDPAELF